MLNDAKHTETLKVWLTEREIVDLMRIAAGDRLPAERSVFGGCMNSFFCVAAIDAVQRLDALSWARCVNGVGAVERIGPAAQGAKGNG